MENQTLTYNRLIWRILKLVAATLRLLFIRKVYRYFPENMPQKGPLIIGVNHSTTAEEAGGLFHVEKGHISILYKKDLEEGRNPLTWLLGKVSKFFLQEAGFIPTRREVKETKATNMVVQALRQNWRVMAMPEGTSRGHNSLIYAKRRGTQKIAISDWGHQECAFG